MMASYGRYNTGVKSAKGGDREHVSVDIPKGPEICGKVLSMVHDVCRGSAPAFVGADCMYSGISWQAGYNTFVSGTDAHGTGHDEYLSGLLSMIEELHVPTYIVCGKREAKKLKPDSSKQIKLVYHNCPAMLCAWNASIPENIGTDIEALEHLLGEHECVVDPCCGFGNTMLRALKHGKRCIMADVDTECIAYVRKLAKEMQ